MLAVVIHAWHLSAASPDALTLVCSGLEKREQILDCLFLKGWARALRLTREVFQRGS